MASRRIAQHRSPRRRDGPLLSLANGLGKRGATYYRREFELSIAHSATERPCFVILKIDLNILPVDPLRVSCNEPGTSFLIGAKM